MQIEVQWDAEAVSKHVAAPIAEHARMAFTAGGRFILAAGGHTPWRMLGTLGKEEVPWSGVPVHRVDGRIAAVDPDGNRTHLQETLLEDAPINPVEIADTQSAATEDAKLLEKLAGSLFASHRQGRCDHRRLARP